METLPTIIRNWDSILERRQRITEILKEEGPLNPGEIASTLALRYKMPANLDEVKLELKTLYVAGVVSKQEDKYCSISRQE